LFKSKIIYIYAFRNIFVFELFSNSFVLKRKNNIQKENFNKKIVIASTIANAYF
jgi:hypothetical protein